MSLGHLFKLLASQSNLFLFFFLGGGGKKKNLCTSEHLQSCEFMEFIMHIEIFVPF